MSEADIENVRTVALLHDIGKIGAPDDILNRSDALSSEGQAVLQEHSKIGGDVLEGLTALKGVADGAKHHHDRYDGRDRRWQLSGKEIPLVARIIAVADAYDSMSRDNDDRKGLAPDEIIDELQKGSGAQFDPEIVPHMLAMITEGVVSASPKG